MAQLLNATAAKILAHIAVDEIEQKDMAGTTNGFAVHDLADQLPFVPPGRLQAAVNLLKKNGLLRHDAELSHGSNEVVKLTPKGWKKFV